MSKTIRWAVLSFLCAGSALAAPEPWSAAPVLDGPEAFQFAIVSDRTGGHRAGVFETALQKANLLRPAFVMSVGDLIEGYDEDGPTIDGEWDEVTGMIRDHLDMRFYFVPGNHDIHWKEKTGLVSQERWLARFGRTYYHFVYKNVLFLCMNSEDPPPTSMDTEQRAYFAKALAENPDVRWTCLFMHKPMWAVQEAKGWAEMEALLADRPYTVFAAHWHQYQHEVRNGHDYFVLATCGGGSGLRGQAHGEMDHLTWVTMNDAGPEVALIELSGVHDQDYRVPTHRDWTRQLDQTPVLPPSWTVALPDAGLAGPMTVSMLVSNPLGVPLRLTLTPRATPWLWPAEGAVTLPLPAAAQDVPLSLPLVGREDWHAVASNTPLRLDYTVSVDEPGVPAFEYAAQTRLCWTPSSPLGTVRRVPAGGIVVDGALDDWGNDVGILSVEPAQLAGTIALWEGPQDCSLRVRVAEDDTYFYVGIAVIDDVLTRNPGAAPDKQDGIQLLLDARAPAQWSKRPSPKDLDGYLVLSASPGVTGAEDLEEASLWPAGTQLAVVQRPGGYACEAAIPHAALDGIQGGSWSQVRLNVRVSDVDGTPLDPRTAYWWLPEWGSTGDDGKNGAFVRAEKP